MAIKHLTLLHSNDLHGDFLPSVDEGVTAGGLAQISGYVKQERAKGATIYAIAGDILRGSTIDSEFKGMATVDVLDHVGPDVITLGNHEVDYGVPQLLFLEKCATFPIVCANMYLKSPDKRLFASHTIIEVDGLRVLFIGLITTATQSQTQSEQLIGEHIRFSDPLPEVEEVCRQYAGETIDLTVVLSHLGWEEDHRLAAALDPSLGVDLIVGGHSHLKCDKPDVVNGIPIVQLGMGSRHMGRYELDIDTDAHRLAGWTWKSVRLTPDTAPADEELAALIDELRKDVDAKYQRVIINLARQLTHPVRYRETELGNLFTDIFEGLYEVDIALLSSASLRGEALGPDVTLADLMTLMPYDGNVTLLNVTGAQLEQAVHHLMRDENWQDNPKFFQVNGNLHLEYDRVNHTIQKFTLCHEDIEPDRMYSVVMDEYHYMTCEKIFNVTKADLEANGRAFSLPMGFRLAALHFFAQYNDARERAKALGKAPHPIYSGNRIINPAKLLDSKLENRIVIHHPAGPYEDGVLQ